MELILLGIYSFFVWLIFFKFKWLPWNIVTQVIIITIPIIGITVLILMLNIVAPSSHDVRVVNYVVPINPRVTGLVTEVPIEPNRPIKKGDVLFRMRPVPFEIEVRNTRRPVAQLQVQLITAEANARSLQEQLKAAAEQQGGRSGQARAARRQRLRRVQGAAETGAGNRFDFEQAQAECANLEGELASAAAASRRSREAGGQDAGGRAGQSGQREGPDRRGRGPAGQCKMESRADRLRARPTARWSR